MSILQQDRPQQTTDAFSAPQKEKWSAPVIVPLDTTLTEYGNGRGFDGETIWADSTNS